MKECLKIKERIDFLSFFVYTDFSYYLQMNKERIKLIVKNMELLVQALKEELNENVNSYDESYKIGDYDEVFEE